MIAILLSGGLDSAVLTAAEAARGEIQPIYVRAGLAWEEAELDAVRAFLAAGHGGWKVRPLASLSVDMTDVYPGAHWAVVGKPPGYHTPDEDVYLPGRNVVLLGKAGIYCATQGIGRLAIGTLDHNPFPDATPEFREAMGRALKLGLGHTVEIEAPFARKSKADVIRLGVEVGARFELTLSCMNPVLSGRAGQAGRAGQTGQAGQAGRASRAGQTGSAGQASQAGENGATEAYELARHCGRCSKCRERHDAFLEANIPDPTDYADTTYIATKRA